MLVVQSAPIRTGKDRATSVATPIKPEKEAQLLRRLESLGIKLSDLEERFIKGRGPGGQKVNKSSSGVYLRHKPTGIEVKVQSDRSQAKNRFLARRQLADRFETEILGKQSAQSKTQAKQKKQKLRRRRRQRVASTESNAENSEPKTTPADEGSTEPTHDP